MKIKDTHMHTFAHIHREWESAREREKGAGWRIKLKWIELERKPDELTYARTLDWTKNLLGKNDFKPFSNNKNDWHSPVQIVNILGF